MRRQRKLMKFASLMVAGGTLFQFGGCWNRTWGNIPVGFGRTIGTSIGVAVDAALLAPFLGPAIDAVAGLVPGAGGDGTM